MTEIGGADWEKSQEDDFSYDFQVPGNYTHIWVKTGPREADRIAIGADLMDDDGLYARLELVLAARNLLPKIIEEHTALLSAYAGMREENARLREALEPLERVADVFDRTPEDQAETTYVRANSSTVPSRNVRLSVADYRRAVAALSQKAEGDAS